MAAGAVGPLSTEPAVDCDNDNSKSHFPSYRELIPLLAGLGIVIPSTIRLHYDKDNSRGWSPANSRCVASTEGLLAMMMPFLFFFGGDAGSGQVTSRESGLIR